ncbi:hypothetical protein [Gemmatimonas phototrophica]|uniref:DUF4168 domain-containing protein n=1 Tax=Gemmatimonas phototrophica TaxID=1379270 RepID=A0A143BIK5_9BACT|nr:hypothetical protein [Gemmatimonas phototrophica]AMW04264.1 hypothetical protein GEMMAAP_04245 [Gemmatimonas phototrophica]
MTLPFAAALVAVLVFAPASAPAQKPAAPPSATVQADSAVEAHARLHLALNGLRDREQVELAEPKNKKPDLQADIRQRYRALRADSLKAHGATAAQFAAMTQRISGDDALRTVFEAALERLSKK